MCYGPTRLKAKRLYTVTKKDRETWLSSQVVTCGDFGSIASNSERPSLCLRMCPPSLFFQHVATLVICLRQPQRVTAGFVDFVSFFFSLLRTYIFPLAKEGRRCGAVRCALFFFKVRQRVCSVHSTVQYQWDSLAQGWLKARADQHPP